MGLTLPVLRSWQPGALASAGQEVATTSATVDDHLQTMTRSMDAAQESWAGDTADAALGHTERVVTAGHRTATALVSLADVLVSAATELSSAQEAALALVENARAEGHLVFDDGRVQAPPVPPGPVPVSAGTAEARQRALNSGAEQHATQIGRALDAAAEADAHWSARITQAVDDIAEMAAKPVTGGAGELSAPVRSIVDGTSQLPSDPQALRDFWAELSAEEKEALIAHDPGIGNRDGIPAVDRDHINQRFLADLRADEQADYDALIAEHPEWSDGFPFDQYGYGERSDAYARYQQWQEKVDGSAQLLRGYDGVGGALGDGPTGNPPRYLLGIDGADRAIIATGNPDTAANVATLVPGTGSTLAGIGGDVDRSQRMLDAAVASGAQSASVATWYGYDAPPSIPNATDEVYAEGGAPALVSFQDGLRATHDGPPSTNTVVGHSYGSTLIGAAATDGHSLNADNLAFVGSPGTLTDDVTDLRLDGVAPAQNGEHVYATAARHDPVPQYGDVTRVFGPNPAGFGYGAHVFTSDSGTRGPWYAGGFHTDAHSEYWEYGSPSLRGLGQIIVGRGSTVQ